MANIRIRAAMERIDKDIVRVRNHIHAYSGVSKDEAYAIERDAIEIALVATQIAAMAMAAQGNRAARTVLKKVRKALGFTYA